MSSELSHFSTNILLLRRRKGLSQQQVADAIGVKRATISNWENGVSYPLFEDLIRLAKSLDTDITTLVSPALAELRLGASQSLVTRQANIVADVQEKLVQAKAPLLWMLDKLTKEEQELLYLMLRERKVTL